MMSTLSAAGSGSTVPTDDGGDPWRCHRRRGQSPGCSPSPAPSLVAMKKSRRRRETTATRHALLREEAAGFTITAVELAERASAVARGPKTPEAVQALRQLPTGSCECSLRLCG